MNVFIIKGKQNQLNIGLCGVLAQAFDDVSRCHFTRFSSKKSKGGINYLMLQQ